MTPISSRLQSPARPISNSLTVGEIVFRLKDFVARAAARFCRRERSLEQGDVQVRGAAPADLALLDQALIGPERLVERRRHVGPVGEVEIDRVGLKALQRGFRRLLDVARLEAFLALAHRRADLGDDNDAAAVPARLHPFADDRLGFAAHIARDPGRIDIGGVDGVEAGRRKAIQHRERGLLVRRPAEHIAAEHERGDGKISASQTAKLH